MRIVSCLGLILILLPAVVAGVGHPVNANSSDKARELVSSAMFPLSHGDDTTSITVALPTDFKVGEAVKIEASVTPSSSDGTVTVQVRVDGGGWIDVGSGRPSSGEFSSIIAAQEGAEILEVRASYSGDSGHIDSTSPIATYYFLEVKTLGGDVTGEGWYREGSSARATTISPTEIEAEKSRLVFTKWTGDSTSTSESITLIMDAPRAVVADWKKQFFLTILNEPREASQGNVDLTSQWVGEGDVITVTALPEAAFSISREFLSKEKVHTQSRLVFTHWSGDTISPSTSTSITLTMNAAQSVTANWQQEFYLTVKSQLRRSNDPTDPEVRLRYGEPQGEGWYKAGETARYSITSPIGVLIQNVLDSWSGDSQAKTAEGTIIMDSPKTITANWRKDFTQLFIFLGALAAASSGAGAIFLSRRKRRARIMLQRRGRKSVSTESVLNRQD